MTQYIKTVPIVFLALCFTLIWAAEPFAQPQELGTTFDVQGSAVSQFDADFDDGGSMSLDYYGVSAGFDHQFSREVSMGFGINYNLQNYDFSGSAGLGALDPWEDIHTYGISTSLSYSPDQHWNFLLTPFVESAAESGADTSESYSYGGFLFASYGFSRDFILGFGGGVVTGLEDTSVIPALFIRWQITDKLLLTNPLSAGPSGPAGLELSYAFTPEWTLGIGGANRSFRFRLDDEDVAPDGIGEYAGFPVWTRLSWQPTDQISLGLYGGYTLSGEITLEDEDGDEITEDDLDPAPFAAITLQISF